MTLPAGGNGAASNATASTAPVAHRISAEEAADLAVAAAERAVEKAKAHLAGAQEALAEAKAARKEVS
jgi:hypothetical protein